MEQNPEELTPMERRERVIGELVLAYSAVLQDGRYDMAFNRLSRHLFALRDVQYEIEHEGDAS